MEDLSGTNKKLLEEISVLKQKNRELEQSESEWEKDGTPIWGSITARAIRDQEGKVVYFDGNVTDITDRKRMEAEILALSITDQLTGLYNRRGFLFHAEQQLKLSERNKSGLLLLFADLIARADKLMYEQKQNKKSILP